MEVSEDRVSVLSDQAEPTSEIDLERARAALKEAELAFAEMPEDPETTAALKRAQVRVQVALEPAAH